ncbi:MAG: Do family serine endopeptidase [Candidatus Omnitrophica bacterium]|nr:Do family serine endopeptidase [Candidatus Omnitrophota bacterium]
MEKIRISVLIFLLILISLSVYAEPSKEALSLQDAFVKVSKDVGQAVVSISAEHTERYKTRYYPFAARSQDRFFKDFFVEGPEQELKKTGLGSGIIIDKEGYILTNEHVIRGADRMLVTLPDGREFEGKVTGADEYSDLAVIKIESKGYLPFAKLGNSDNVKIGYWAIAIGNPFAFAVKNPEPTVTVGVVSALHRSLPRTDKRTREYSDLIQTDAAINPGNSGGPLVDISGEIIGINVAIFTMSGGSEGVGFAIPINTAKKIMDDLIQGRHVIYGWIGVIIQDLDSNLVEYFGLQDKNGVLISRIVDDSPAYRAGLKPGDIVISIDSESIRNTQDLVRQLLKKQVGEITNLGIVRNGKLHSIDVQVDSKPEDKTIAVNQKDTSNAVKQPESKNWRGLDVSDITPDMILKLKMSVDSGVVVISVAPGSSAEQAGIRPGDVIYEINRMPVKSSKDYSSAIDKASGDVLVGTYRGYVVLKEK